ncbi:MAG: polysaccharide deacetylase family protein [Actinomycetota bacterium]|nr:polysaccharide deacetylase family protein [Actinomycetota bacterium]
MSNTSTIRSRSASLQRQDSRRAFLRRQRLIRSGLVIVFIATVAIGAPRLGDLPPPVVARVGGRLFLLPPHATVATGLRKAGLKPVSGRLMSIRGSVLSPEAFPFKVTRNGLAVGLGEHLRTHDVIVLTNGTDQAEPTTVETYAQPASDPQFVLAGSGNLTAKRGTVSGEVEPISVAAGTGPPTVALTFDDGPNPNTTPPIIDILDRAGIKATFFTVGRMVQRFPDLVRRELGDGMTIGDHTFGHTRLAGLPADRVRGELQRTIDQLGPLGAHVTLMRPPDGSFDASTIEVAKSMGLRTVVWSVDSKDWSKPGVDAIVRRVVDSVHPGSIILMHDGGPDRSQTVAALPRIIDELRARGYSFTAMA